MALIIRDRLREYGYHWHADRVENWIHRKQPKKKKDLNFSVQLGPQAEMTSRREEREEASF
jgi:hypothetical protein